MSLITRLKSRGRTESKLEELPEETETEIEEEDQASQLHSPFGKPKIEIGKVDSVTNSRVKKALWLDFSSRLRVLECQTLADNTKLFKPNENPTPPVWISGAQVFVKPLPAYISGYPPAPQQ